ncbi:hypothetical protein K2X83_00430 [Patescibacteria group bacterium]|nr:hypothetical protein [Patescibacteria group bacterium]
MNKERYVPDRSPVETAAWVLFAALFAGGTGLTEANHEGLQAWMKAFQDLSLEDMSFFEGMEGVYALLALGCGIKSGTNISDHIEVARQRKRH